MVCREDVLPDQEHRDFPPLTHGSTEAVTRAALETQSLPSITDAAQSPRKRGPEAALALFCACPSV